MAKNDDVKPADQGAPAADIPNLKKKEEERKKSGAAWSGLKPGGSFSGAGGGIARAAASAAAGGAAAAEGAGASWLSALMATALGKMLLLAGTAAVLLGAGLLAAGMLKGGTGGDGGVGDLGAIASSMKVRSGGGDRTGVASKGEIMFDPAAKAPAKAPEKAPEDAKPADDQAADKAADAGAGADGNPGENFTRPGLEHNLSGSKLSSSLGGGFGGKNIFSGNSAAPKLNEGLSHMNMPGGQRGKLTASRNNRTGRKTSGGRGRQMTGSRAMAQLRIAKGLSVGATSTSGAAMAAQAGSAFDGGKAGGSDVAGTPPGGQGDGLGSTTSPSTPGGAPDITIPDVPEPPGDWKDKLAAAQLKAAVDTALAAKKLRDQGTALIIAGFVLYAAGIVCLCWPLTAVGLVLIAIGLILMGIGSYLQSEADKQEQSAYDMAEKQFKADGNKEQWVNAQICIKEAIENGTPSEECDPKDPKYDAEREQLDKEAAEKAKKRDEENAQTTP